MFKSIIKEIFIILLIIIAILLVLAILMYEYNPASIKTPNKVEAYALSQEMQEELNETIKANETQNIIKTYRVDATDLEIYEESNDYDKGKPNPFDKIGTSGQNNTNTNSTGNTNTNSTGNTNTNSSTTTQNTSQGQFLNNTGK